MAIHAKLLLSFFLALGTHWGLGQEGAISLKTDAALPAMNNQLVTIRVELENKSDTDGDFQLEASAGRFINLIQQSASIAIGANEKRFSSLKVYVTKDQPAGKAPIKLKLFDKNKNLVAESTTVLEIEAKKGLRITTLDPQEVIYQIGDSLRVKAQVHNLGNQQEKVLVAAVFPTLSGTPITLEKTLTLKPFSTTDVVFSKIIDRDLLQQELFNVNLSLLTEENVFVGNTMVLVQNALGNRRYVDPNQQRLLSDLGTGNQVSWSIRNPFSKFDAAQSFDLSSSVSAGNLRADLNLHATMYHNADLPTLFQNTYLSLERKGIGVQVGNLTATDLDISLVGRGAEVFLKPFDKRRSTVRLGAVEKSYNLFDPLDFNNMLRGYSAYLTSEHQVNDKVAVGADLIYDQDIFSKSILATSQYEYSYLNTRYQFSLGYGNSQDIDNSSLQKNSIAAGISYYTRLKEYTISSENFYSTGYYPGLRKGTTLFNQRIGRQFGKINAWVGYSLNFYEPKNISSEYNYSTNTKRHKGELGVYFRAGDNFVLTFTPQIQFETANALLSDYSTLYPFDFQLGSLYSSATYATPNGKHRFTLSHTQGLARFKGITPADFVYRSQLTYNFNQFILSASMQKGNFLLYEGVRGGEASNDTKKYTALATYSKNFFMNRLTMNLTGMATKDDFLGTNAAISTNAELKIGKRLKVFGYYTYTKYFSDLYDYRNSYVQFGLTYALPRFGDPSVNYKNGTIEIFVFYDHNNNGSFDPQIDEPASDHRVSIGKTLFVSDKTGEVSYRKLPYGSYEIKSVESDWYFSPVVVNLSSNKEQLLMPLEKTGLVTGKLSYDKYNRNQYEVSSSLSGITVLFTSTSGRTFRAYTNEDGTYQAFIPLGEYQMHIDPESLQENVYVEGTGQKLTSKENETTVLPQTILKIRERKVEIQRFGE